MDRIMRPFGLNGKGTIPLISGAACAIPAIAAKQFRKCTQKATRCVAATGAESPDAWAHGRVGPRLRRFPAPAPRPRKFRPKVRNTACPPLRGIFSPPEILKGRQSDPGCMMGTVLFAGISLGAKSRDSRACKCARIGHRRVTRLLMPESLFLRLAFVGQPRGPGDAPDERSFYVEATEICLPGLWLHC